MRCWVAIRHRGFSVSEVFGECKKIELASVLEWVKVVNFSWLTIRCVWITWYSCSLRILFFSVYIIEAILSWTFVWLMCCSKCIWMSVTFSLVFGFWILCFFRFRHLLFRLIIEHCVRLTPSAGFGFRFVLLLELDLPMVYFVFGAQIFIGFRSWCGQLHEVSPFFKVFWCCSSSDF